MKLPEEKSSLGTRNSGYIVSRSEDTSNVSSRYIWVTLRAGYSYRKDRFK